MPGAISLPKNGRSMRLVSAATGNSGTQRHTAPPDTTRRGARLTDGSAPANSSELARLQLGEASEDLSLSSSLSSDRPSELAARAGADCSTSGADCTRRCSVAACSSSELTTDISIDGVGAATLPPGIVGEYPNNCWICACLTPLAASASAGGFAAVSAVVAAAAAVCGPLFATCVVLEHFPLCWCVGEKRDSGCSTPQRDYQLSQKTHDAMHHGPSDREE